jgi:2-oxoglutarate dehydrogenase E2 component (dihydrolipoamide succinyltransferase)
MGEYKLLMPKMGESVIEATILAWHKKVGDTVNEQDVILEVATDKVDSEVPSPVSGVIKELLYGVDAVVGVGEPLAILEVEGEMPAQFIPEKKNVVVPIEKPVEQNEKVERPAADKTEETVDKKVEQTVASARQTVQTPVSSANRYYSPLVLNIAQVENVSMQELETISGSGVDGRVTKEDILEYVDKKRKGQLVAPPKIKEASAEQKTDTQTAADMKTESIAAGSSNTEIIEMDRMRKLIAQHMVNSLITSAHVSSFVECDVTNIVKWREKHRHAFQKREGFSLSFMPVFVEAIAKAIKDFPMINVSVDGDKIIKKKDINIGVATALPSGNLIVPVIRNADQKSLLGIAKTMSTIIQKARTNSLQADDVSDGTYTISNIGTFGNIIGTPIINQPQVAIMAVGSITKKPVVIEAEGQDVIAIRHMMYLSHTYDHRVVDGMLGGFFVKKVADYLEKFDLYQEI